MATYEIETPDGATYEIEAQNEQQLQAVVAQLSRPRRNLAQENPAEYDPNSSEYQAKYGPTSGMSKGGRFLAGIGQGFANLGRGIQQLESDYGTLPSRTYDPQTKTTREIQPTARKITREDVDAQRAIDAPLLQGWGRAGSITGGIAAALPTMFIPGANTYTGAALIGGGLGAIQPVGASESRGTNTALGAGGGIAGKYVGDRLASLARPKPVDLPEGISGANGSGQAASNAQAGAQVGPGVSSTETTVSGGANVTGSGGGYTFGTVGADPSAGLTQAQKNALQIGRTLGFKPTPGQASGSRALQQLEAKLESQPMTSGPFNTLKDANQKVLNRAAAKAIGEKGASLDATVLEQARNRIGKVFDDVADDQVRAINPDQTLEKLSAIETDFEGLLDSSIVNHPLAKRLFTFAEKGGATGEQLRSLSSKLGNAINKQFTAPSGDRDLGFALAEVKDYVDDALGSTLSGERAAAFKNARQQYRNLILLTSQQNVVNPATGNVSGRALASVLQRKDKLGYLYGRNKSDMYNAARFAQAFQPIVGDSGTATRSALPSATDFVLSLPFNLASRAYLSSPAVNLSTAAQAVSQAGANAAARAVGPLARPLATPTARYAPYVLPGQLGLLGSELGQ